MICKSCGAENKEWASYCTQCGIPLGDVCRCSFRNEPGNLYCGGCGRPLMANDNERLNKETSPNILDPIDKPLSEILIKRLIRESLLMKVDEDDGIDQNDIDLMFSLENDSSD